MSVTLNPEVPDFLAGNLLSAIQNGFNKISKTVRVSNNLPAGETYQNYKEVPHFDRVTNQFIHNVVYQMNTIFVQELPSARVTNCNVEYNMERLLDANDIILDRVNYNAGFTSGTQPNRTKGQSGYLNPVVKTIQVGATTFTGAKNIVPPQLKFKDKIDNWSSLWQPKLTYKPNNIRPLALELEYNDQGEAIGYINPYMTELDSLKLLPKWMQAEAEEPSLPPPPEETPLTYIDTEKELNRLMEHLETVDEIAVDLEHHNYRSFQGFTCLIQMTTTAGDFIVDALALREHLYKLNEVFTNPKILKILHGANMDVQWLQRDFGVYVVGMFDTHQAARELGHCGKSLVALLKRYCQLDIDKKHQLSDWRLRPLTPEMLKYARIDTHYLRYIWRRMRADLLAADEGRGERLRSVFESSRQVCSLTYQKQIIKENSYMKIYYSNKKLFNSRQLAALRMLFRWRHESACELDESTMYLLPNHMMLSLAENLPRDVHGISALCTPAPPFVKQNLITIQRILLSCRELPLETDPLSTDAIVANVETPVADNVHDVPEMYDDDQPSPQEDESKGLTEQEVDIDLIDFSDAVVPSVSMFNDKGNGKANESKTNCKRLRFLPPIERYLKYRTLLNK